MREIRKRTIKRFLVLFFIVSILATGVTILSTWFIGKFTGYSPSFYEPKDAERQKLYDEKKKSVSE